MGFELLTVVQWVCAALVGNIAAFFLIKLIALTREKHKGISGGGIIPEEPSPEQRPCYLTEQIHEAARAAGLCVECGESKEACGGWYPDALTGSPSVPGWVCGVKNPEQKALIKTPDTEQSKFVDRAHDRQSLNKIIQSGYEIGWINRSHNLDRRAAKIAEHSPYNFYECRKALISHDLWGNN